MEFSSLILLFLLRILFRLKKFVLVFRQPWLLIDNVICYNQFTFFFFGVSLLAIAFYSYFWDEPT